MKRKYLTVAVVMALATSLLGTSCIGRFQLTNKLLSWNHQVGNKFVNELVFFAFWILPVYEVSALADLLVLNSIEFWSGSNPVAQGKKMIDEIARAGFKVMIFSGGEPLMRPDIYELVAHAASRGLRPVFGSNGTLITPELAARFADVWVTVTGNCKVVDGPAFENMKDGAIICNSGHFDSEINMKWLRANAVKVEELKPLVESTRCPTGAPSPCSPRGAL